MLIYIHAGMHKTGSTFLQNTLMENRRALERAGIAVWPYEINDGPIVRCAAGDPLLKMSPRDVARGRQRLLRHIAARRKSGFRKYILVGEGVGVRLDPDAVLRLRAALESTGGDVRVIFYIREPVSFAAASIQERVRNGGRLAKLRKRGGAPLYRKRMEGFFRHFPRDNIDVRLFAPPAFAGGELLRDFLFATGEEDIRARLTPTRIANESLCVEATHLWERLSRTAPEAKVWPFRQHVHDVLAAMPGRPFRLSPVEAERVLRESAPDVAWLRERLGHDPFAGVETPPGSLDWDAPEEMVAFYAELTLEAARARMARAGWRTSLAPGRWLEAARARMARAAGDSVVGG